MNSMLTSNPNMSVLALVFQNSVNCSQSSVFLLVLTSGTHSVCVCTYHQNMKLLLAPLNVTYQGIFPLIVCDINNKEYMVHRCPNCPESNTLLQDFLFHTVGDHSVLPPSLLGDQILHFYLFGGEGVSKFHSSRGKKSGFWGKYLLGGHSFQGLHSHNQVIVR